MVLLGTLSGAAWFGLFLVGHLSVFRLRHVRQRAAVILRFFVVAVGGFVASITSRFVAFRPPGDAGAAFLVSVVVGLAVMASLFVLYVPFYYMVATSLSIQTLIAIRHAPGQSVRLAALQSPEALERILEGRLDRLVESGNLSRHGEGFRLTARGERIARTFRRVNECWRLGPGG